jgi:hypothetical protein
MFIDYSKQLVSSATTTSKTDAFNFLAQGAGPAVFEIFLKVSNIIFLPRVSAFMMSLQALHCPSFRHNCLFFGKSTSSESFFAKRCPPSEKHATVRVLNGYMLSPWSCLASATLLHCGAQGSRSISQSRTLSKDGATSLSERDPFPFLYNFG